METCPHCGKRLPLVVDAFCPECWERLDEIPVTGENAEGQGDNRRPSKAGVSIGPFLMMGGLALLFVAVLAFSRRNWPDALNSAITAIVLLAFGTWFSGRSRQKRANAKPGSAAERPRE